MILINKSVFTLKIISYIQMINTDNKIHSEVKNFLNYNFLILSVFLFWFVYSTFNIGVNIVLFSLFILIFVSIMVLTKIKKGVKSKVFSLYGILILVLSFFLLDAIFYFLPNNPVFLFSFYNLIGLRHRFELVLFSVLISIILIKLIIIYFYVKAKPRVLEIGKGDEFFQFFTTDLNTKKISQLLILFPLSALVEELIYRSLFLSFLIYYFNFNIVVAVSLVSLIFGFVHYSSSKNSGHVFSTLISSIIYFIALIHLGLLYSWMFHLATNLFVLVFYYQARKRKMKSL